MAGRAAGLCSPRGVSEPAGLDKALRGGSGCPSGSAFLPARPGSWQLLYPHVLPQEQLSYEERACEGGCFAAVEVTGKPFDEASKEGVLKLLKYVGGTNDKGEKCSLPRRAWRMFVADHC